MWNNIGWIVAIIYPQVVDEKGKGKGKGKMPAKGKGKMPAKGAPPSQWTTGINTHARNSACSMGSLVERGLPCTKHDRSCLLRGDPHHPHKTACYLRSWVCDFLGGIGIPPGPPLGTTTPRGTKPRGTTTPGGSRPPPAREHSSSKRRSLPTRACEKAGGR